MTRLARVAFAVLVLATLGAFVVTQKLKSAPPLVVRPHISSVFSPAPDARVRQARVSFFVLHGDQVVVTIVDANGVVVRQLLDGPLPARKRVTRFWNGRTAAGTIALDGLYTVRVALIHQGRTIDLAPQIRLDTAPPRPRVVAITPRPASGPAFLPQRGVRAVTIRLAGLEGRRALLELWRTDVSPSRRVAQLPIPSRARTTTWDGVLDGAPAPPGTYLMGLRVADRSGNVGTYPAVLPPRAGAVDGRPGVTIRRLAVAPPLTPVTAGRHTTVFVDARGHDYAWALRRAGAARLLAHGSARGARLRVRIPHQQSGLDVLTVVSGAHRTAVPLAVRSGRVHSVLVVLPALTWQGGNPVDDDGDGLPNTLDTGGPVDVQRPFARGLPASVGAEQGPLLALLDANLLRYDVTTDLALATGAGPPLAGHRGVILAGDERWVTLRSGTALRAYVRGGGRVWSLGVDALRRSVHLSGARLANPSSPQLVDVFGARPRQPLVHPATPATMTIYQDGALGLFQHTSGAFPGYRSYETLAPFAAPAKLLSAAGPVAGTPVIAAWSLGAGVAIHTGLPQLAARARAGDPDATALVLRIWSLLATR